MESGCLPKSLGTSYCCLINEKETLQLLIPMMLGPVLRTGAFLRSLNTTPELADKKGWSSGHRGWLTVRAVRSALGALPTFCDFSDFH